MAYALLDWKGREIGNPWGGELSGPPENREKLHFFYDEYVQALNQGIGLPEDPFKGLAVRNWKELFNKIEQEYRRHPFLPKMFGSYGAFFNGLFVKPYGLEYQPGRQLGGNFTDVSGAIEDKEEQKIALFARRLNLPLLLYVAMENHGKKYQELERCNESLDKEKMIMKHKWSRAVSDDTKMRPRISSSFIISDPAEPRSGAVKPLFRKNFWKEVISSHDECIFITYNQPNDQVILQKYWFASLLHLAHPRIHYLHFAVGHDKESKSLRELFPESVWKVKLMETSHRDFPLIVGGVLGEDLHNLESKVGFRPAKSGVPEFIDRAIWNYFRSRWPEGQILYNLSHIIRDQAADQFSDYAKSTYRKGFTAGTEPADLRIPWDLEEIVRLSATKSRYQGEQYSEAFSRPAKSKKEKEERLGSFVPLEGKVAGVCAKDYQKKERRFLKRDWRPSAGAIVYGTLAAASLLFGIWYQDQHEKKSEGDLLVRSSDKNPPVENYSCSKLELHDGKVQCKNGEGRIVSEIESDDFPPPQYQDGKVIFAKWNKQYVYDLIGSERVVGFFRELEQAHQDELRPKLINPDQSCNKLVVSGTDFLCQDFRRVSFHESCAGDDSCITFGELLSFQNEQVGFESLVTKYGFGVDEVSEILEVPCSEKQLVDFVFKDGRRQRFELPGGKDVLVGLSDASHRPLKRVMSLLERKLEEVLTKSPDCHKLTYNLNFVHCQGFTNSANNYSRFVPMEIEPESLDVSIPLGRFLSPALQFAIKRQRDLMKFTFQDREDAEKAQDLLQQFSERQKVVCKEQRPNRLSNEPIVIVPYERHQVSRQYFLDDVFPPRKPYPYYDYNLLRAFLDYFHCSKSTLAPSQYRGYYSPACLERRKEFFDFLRESGKRKAEDFLDITYSFDLHSNYQWAKRMVGEGILTGSEAVELCLPKYDLTSKGGTGALDPVLVTEEEFAQIKTESLRTIIHLIYREEQEALVAKLMEMGYPEGLTLWLEFIRLNDYVCGSGRKGYCVSKDYLWRYYQPEIGLDAKLGILETLGIGNPPVQRKLKSLYFAHPQADERLKIICLAASSAPGKQFLENRFWQSQDPSEMTMIGENLRDFPQMMASYSYLRRLVASKIKYEKPPLVEFEDPTPAFVLGYETIIKPSCSGHRVISPAELKARSGVWEQLVCRISKESFDSERFSDVFCSLVGAPAKEQEKQDSAPK